MRSMLKKAKHLKNYLMPPLEIVGFQHLFPHLIPLLFSALIGTWNACLASFSVAPFTLFYNVTFGWPSHPGP